MQVPDYKGNGGESGIRTHVTLSSKHAFQACAFSHSAISPARLLRWEAVFCKRKREPRSAAHARSDVVIPLDFLFDSMADGTEPQPARGGSQEKDSCAERFAGIVAR